MRTLKIKRIEIQGFRAFGKNAQTLDFNSLIACIWGPNSQGKTSLAEAFEFLFTGEILRRALLASAQDEFADALRNVHMPQEFAVFVEAMLVADDKTHVVRRTLVADYGKKQDCQSVLHIDGKVATEADFAAIGVVLSQPPLRAPVLAQHTLAYLFSAKPQDRASYFKALLEVTDLEALRSAVASLDTALPSPDSPLLLKLRSASQIRAVSASLHVLTYKVPTAEAIQSAVSAALVTLITAEGQTPPETLVEQIATIETILVDKRTRTFPIKGFDKANFVAASSIIEEPLAALAAYLTERHKVNEETRRLASLFAEALALPHVAEVTDPIDCPLCTTEKGLTSARVAVIQERVRDTDSFRTAEKAAAGAISHLKATIEAARKQAADAMPRFIMFSAKTRRERGFRIARIVALIGSEKNDAIEAWIRALCSLSHAHARVSRIAGGLLLQLRSYEENLESFEDAEALSGDCANLFTAIGEFAKYAASYGAAEKPISESLKTVIDAQSETTGWADLIDIANDLPGLRAALIAAASVAQLQKELTQALRQIDGGNEKVLDEKFGALSVDVETWWNLLRPDELSFFTGICPRPGARRTIDFKAGLSLHEDRSNTTFRDVIAVFSQSQLHCLGLALFIARSVHENTGFIILDDPILSSDEDYRAHFNSAALEKLIDSGVQVILLTQDQKTSKDITERYLHRHIDTFQINLNNPAEGTTVVNKADDLGAMLSRAEVLIRGGHPDLQKQGGELLRDAAERFCKEALVKRQRAKGDNIAAISDYDGKTLGELGPKTEPLLTADPSHPGKLRTIGNNLNPSNHDDAIPGVGTLKVALGDLRALRKAYL
jgi:hypothetical protein